jgi:hypothetical protein
MAIRSDAVREQMMRAGFYLRDDFGPPPIYILIEGTRYVQVSHAADQMLAAIESAEKAMAKKPKDAPEIGDRVERKGFGERGTLVQVDTDDYWSHVKWDHSGPVLIHLFELRKL